jgi:5'-3' exonuclease
MGIPYYFYTLTKSYNDIISSKFLHNPDLYFLDFNGIIHPVCQQCINNSDSLDIDEFEEMLLKRLSSKVYEDIEILKPKKVFICVDGTVPLAKIAQQRKRRYLTAYKNKIDGKEVKWDTNAITPGTAFMKKLDTYFKKEIRYNCSSAHLFYSGSDEFGEGEHKIFHLLQSVQDMQYEAIIMINGLDADLIILSLMSNKKNIYLMREGKTAEEENMYISIDNLRSAIINELKIKWDICDEINEIDLIESYCVMCSLLGNDFIPHPLSLNLKTNGTLDKLIYITGLSYKTNGLLVHNSNINHNVLADILQSIAKTEDNDVYRETEKYIKNKVHCIKPEKSEFYAIKNKESIATAIYANIAKWRQIYYKHMFHTNILIDSSVIHLACSNYIKGIYWTYAYYKKQPIDLQWYYPYAHPPSIRDIANYAVGNTRDDIYIVDKTNNGVDNITQLLIVLPIESKILLDPKYQIYMQDISKGLLHLFPRKYPIHTFLKTHLWECAPELPIINIPYIAHKLQHNHIKLK